MRAEIKEPTSYSFHDKVYIFNSHQKLDILSPTKDKLCGNLIGGSTDKNGLVGAIPSEDLIWVRQSRNSWFYMSISS